jgi:hypothetical protein
MNAITRVATGRLSRTDLSDGANILNTADTSIQMRVGTGVTSGGVASITFSSPFSTAFTGAVITGAGNSCVFFANGSSASGLTVTSASGDGAFAYLAFGH